MSILESMMKSAGLDPAQLHRQYVEFQEKMVEIFRHFDGKLSEISGRLDSIERAMAANAQMRDSILAQARQAAEQAAASEPAPSQPQEPEQAPAAAPAPARALVLVAPEPDEITGDVPEYSDGIPGGMSAAS